MKKCVLMMSFILCSISYGKTQSLLKYQGDLQVGYSYGIGDYSYDKFNLHIINGIRIGKYISTGIGTGLDFHYKNNLESLNCGRMGEKTPISIPIFFNIKGYLPVTSKINLFASTDIGGSVGLNHTMKNLTGLLFSPGVGVNLNLFSSHSLSCGIGYVLQKWERNDFEEVQTESIQFKLGFSF